LLYPLAEYHQQRGNLAASQESGITKKTLIHVEKTIWKCCINMLFCAIICILLFIKKGIYKRFYFIFTSFCTLFNNFLVSFPPIFCHFYLHFIIFQITIQYTDIQYVTFVKPFL
jgi:hypothetical protein